MIEAATSCYPGSDLRIEIIGDKGTAVLINDRLVRWEFAAPQTGDADALREGETPAIAGGTSDAKSMSGEGHRQLVHDLARALREGRPPMIPGAEARRSVALVLAIYEAARSGRSARVDGAE